MLFNSYGFVFAFFPLTFVFYYACRGIAPKNSGGRNTGDFGTRTPLLVLLLASLLFYSWKHPEYLPVLLGSMAVNYLLSDLMDRDSGKGKKAALIAGLVFNLGLLLVFKYMDTGGFVPLGISFFTFTQIAFLMERYRGNLIKVSMLSYGLYVSFFPKVMQGPIALPGELLAQFENRLYRKKEQGRSLEWERVYRGLCLFVPGLFKKVLIADTLGKAADFGYANLTALNSGDALIVMLSYTLQLYFDFSGYCDMAYGIGQMLNIELPLNFHSPYKAESISDFWDRWHITLTKFFTKYVYIPLGGSRKGNLRTCINIMLVFLLSGFWHGANWTFVLWGVLNGILMVLERVFKKGIEKVPKLLRRGITFILIVFLWSIFRAPTVAHEKVLLTQIGLWKFGAAAAEFTEYFNELTEIRFLGRFGLQGMIDAYPAIPFLVFLFFLLAAVWFFKNTGEKTEELAFTDTKRYGFKMAEAVLLLTWSILSLSEISEFIYFNF